MESTPDPLEAAIRHEGGPLLLLGGAGTGKTRALGERVAWLVERGEAAERILVLAPTPAAADSLRETVERRLAGGYAELSITTIADFCARLLTDEALEAGLDPFAVPVTAADRLALMLARIDELPLRHHDFRGNAAALLASFVRRIDRLKDEMVSAEDYARWAAALPSGGDDAARARAAREKEFAEVYAAHDRLLSGSGLLDAGDLVLGAFRLLHERPHVRARVSARYPYVLLDELQELNFARRLLIRLLVSEREQLFATADDDQALHRFRGAAAKNIREFTRELPGATVVRLTQSRRCPVRVVRAAAAVVAPVPDRVAKEWEGRDAEGAVELWRCTNERAQAQSVAADVERLVGRDGVPPERIAVLVRSLEHEGPAVAVALEERAVPHRLVGGAAFFARAEVRDLLAWLRVAVDPGDAGAVARTLARPPVELRPVDLARVTQIARRRRLDMVAGLVAATESPQIAPEARERILLYLGHYRSMVATLDTMRPDLFVHGLIERLGLRRQQLFAAQADVVERLRALAQFGELAARFGRREPQGTARDFARYVAAVAEAGLPGAEDEEPPGRGPAVEVLAMEGAKGREWDHVYVLGLHAAALPGTAQLALEPIAEELLKEAVPAATTSAHVAAMRRLLHVAMTRARERLVLAYPAAGDRGAAQPPSPLAEDARAALGVEWEDREEELFGPAESLHATYRLLRDEVLETIARTGSRLGELRFDTDLDIAHAVARYLELVKLAALVARPAGQSVEEALPQLNARLMGAVTSTQREILQTSSLDEWLLDAERDERRRARALAARSEPSLEAFLPRRGDGLVLSASDIDTYRTCPLRYKFARVFRIPSEQTLNQRFGILIHQVLERFHAAGGTRSLSELLGLLDAGWRRGGFGDSDQERQLRGKATDALTRYLDRLRGDDAEPVWFEKAFSFRMGPHLLRGRVDRVDRLADGGYELIDYKTGRPKTETQLRDDVQLSLYAIAAREAWQLEGDARQAYWYVLDDEKISVPRAPDEDRDWIGEVVLEVAEGILGQGFEPTPSYPACSTCDYRIVCPAAER